jgi:hypothetical protein
VTQRYEFCTVLDSGYLARGLVLYRSLVERSVAFRLRVVCMDEKTERLLEQLALPGVDVISVGELEGRDPGLRAVRPDRTIKEYCWTLKPSLVLYLLEHEPELEQLAYIDADHMFWNDPAPIYRELDGGSVLIVPQRTESERVGRYNAGYVLFARSEATFEILRWWRERCLEHCEAGIDQTGDQGYLSEWPTRFAGVRVLHHPGGGLAPWNSNQHVLGTDNGVVTVDGLPLLFFHHQSLRLYRGLQRLHRLGLLGEAYRFQPRPVPVVWSINRWYRISEEERALVWEPYVSRVAEAVRDLQALDPGFDAGLRKLTRREIGDEVLRRVALRPARRALRRAERVLRQARPAGD